MNIKRLAANMAKHVFLLYGFNEPNQKKKKKRNIRREKFEELVTKISPSVFALEGQILIFFQLTIQFTNTGGHT